MRVDEPRPSSARGETPRSHVPHVAVSLFVASPASGPENAAVAAEAQKAATHPARRRGEERPHLRRRGDGVEALLRHREARGQPLPAAFAVTLGMLVSYMPLATKLCRSASDAAEACCALPVITQVRAIHCLRSDNFCATSEPLPLRIS